MLLSEILLESGSPRGLVSSLPGLIGVLAFSVTFDLSLGT